MKIVTREELNIDENVKKRVELLIPKMIEDFNLRINNDVHYFHLNSVPEHFVSCNGNFMLNDLLLKSLNELLNKHDYIVGKYGDWYVFKYSKN